MSAGEYNSRTLNAYEEYLLSRLSTANKVIERQEATIQALEAEARDGD